MSVQIRHSVFETNSSSSHSLTIAPGELLDFGLDRKTLRRGEIEAVIHANGYGWAYQRYYTPESKIGYLLFQAVGGQLPEEVLGLDAGADHLEAFRKKRSNAVDTIIEIVREATGCDIRLTRDTADTRYGYYVDHQSSYVGLELLDDRDRLLKLIFGDGSYIETGNDNSRPGEYIVTDRGTEPYYANRYVSDPVGERFGFSLPDWSGRAFDFAVDVDDVRQIPGFDHGDAIDFVNALSTSVIDRFVVRSPLPDRFRSKAEEWARHLAFKHFGDRLARYAADVRLASDVRVDFVEADFKPHRRGQRADDYSCEEQAIVTVHALANPDVLKGVVDVVDEIAARHLPLGRRLI